MTFGATTAAHDIYRMQLRTELRTLMERSTLAHAVLFPLRASYKVWRVSIIVSPPTQFDGAADVGQAAQVPFRLRSRLVQSDW